MKKQKDFDRRDFVKTLAGVAALSVMPFDLLFAAQTSSSENKRLSWLANRCAKFEGSFLPRKIDGEIPKLLSGTLFRNGPGSKEVYGRSLGHYFDGDAYLTALRFSNGLVSVQSKFIETVERTSERQSKKMLYHDFGTACEGSAKGYKNPPNIHVLPFSEKLMVLSESTHPVEVNKENLETIGLHDFGGGLPSKTTFTAHPKIDPKSGNTYGFGITQSLFPDLKVFKILNNKVTEMASVGLGGFFPVHDMLMTENYLLFVVSPLNVDLMKAAMMSGPIADALEYDASKPIRIIVVAKDGSSEPIEIESQPSGLIFHHVNAYEDPSTGRIVFDSFVIENASAYEVFKNWAATNMPVAPKTQITRFEVDLKSANLVSRKALTESITTDFPCIDARTISQKTKVFYALESDSNDPLAFNVLTRWNVEDRTSLKVRAGSGQAFGEVVYVGGSQGDSLMHLGYDAGLDETFLDIRHTQTLEILARVWLGRYIPLGFHGSFVS